MSTPCFETGFTFASAAMPAKGRLPDEPLSVKEMLAGLARVRFSAERLPLHPCRRMMQPNLQQGEHNHDLERRAGENGQAEAPGAAV
jgi:hypothetical protein